MAGTPEEGAGRASEGRAHGSPRYSHEPARLGRILSRQLALWLTPFAVVVVSVSFLVLSGIRLPATATIHLSGISRVDFKGQVTAEFSAYVQHVHLGSPSGQVDLALPVPGSQCQNVAKALDGTCGSTGLTLGTSLDAQWDSPEQVTLVSHKGSEVTLTAMPPEQGGGMEMVFTGGGPPRLCLVGSLDRARLTVGPSAKPVTVTTGGAQPPPSCEGLILHLMSSQPTGQSAFGVAQVADASATLTGSEMEVSASGEQFTVTPGDRDVSVSGPLTLHSETPFTLTTTGPAANVTTVTDVHTAKATSVYVFGAERIPTEWQRLSALLGALGLVSLVVAILGPLWSHRRKE